MICVAGVFGFIERQSKDIDRLSGDTRCGLALYVGDVVYCCGKGHYVA